MNHFFKLPDEKENQNRKQDLQQDAEHHEKNISFWKITQKEDVDLFVQQLMDNDQEKAGLTDPA